MMVLIPTPSSQATNSKDLEIELLSDQSTEEETGILHQPQSIMIPSSMHGLPRNIPSCPQCVMSNDRFGSLFGRTPWHYLW